MSAGPETLDDLRRAFDSAFASAPAPALERVDLIALRAGARSYAVRVSDIAGVVRFGDVVPLPCGEPALLGLAAVHGMPLPVYDLAALLGDGAAQAPRWMLLSTGAERVALAFDEIEEYLRVGREHLAAAGHATAASSPSRELLREGRSLRPVVSVAAIVRELRQRLGLPMKER
jgi:chemotaxis signal transduction protein